MSKLSESMMLDLVNMMKEKSEKAEKGAKEPKNKFLAQKVDVNRQGSQIVLPEKMSYDDAIEVLKLRKQEEETKVSVYEEVDCFPLDGAYAFMKAMQRTYGWATPVPKKGFFGDTPPTTVSLEVDYGKYEQIIWGQFKIPTIEGTLETGAAWEEDQPQFIIKGTVLKKYQPEVKALAELTREIIKTESIYRGKPLLLKTNEDGEIDSKAAPKFLDLSRVNEDELVFPDDVMEQVRVNLFTPVEQTEACRANRVPLKRGVLLEGPYGTGKTLTAYVTAKKCVTNAWTFIYVDRVTAIREAILFARRFQPAVVFAEDIDRVVSGGRSVAVDDVLNNVDGVDSKNSELILILTTNHVEKIEPAMIRPGRLDAVISIQKPDAIAAEKLVRIYAGPVLDDKKGLKEAGKELAGQIPATIREVVERSKLYAISRSAGKDAKITGADIAHAARGMKNHLALLQPKVVQTVPTLDQAFGNLVAEKFANGAGENLRDMKEKVDYLYDNA